MVVSSFIFLFFCARDGSGKPAGQKPWQAAGGGATLGATKNG